MKKYFILTIILFTSIYFGLANNTEKILLDSLRNSITEGSFSNYDQDLVFIEWTTLVDEKKASNETDYVGQSATINYLRTNDYSYKKLVYTIFSMTSEVTKQRIMLYDRSSMFVNDRLSRDVIKTTAKASIAEIVDDDLKLKEEYKIISSDSDNLRDRDAWKITIQNTGTGSTTIFWIDKEYNVRLQEDYFDTYPVLFQRIEYLDYQKLPDGTLIEKKYSIWGQNFPGSVRFYQIKDPRFRDIDDKFFSPDILKKL